MRVASAAHVCPQCRRRPRHARLAQRGQEGSGRGLALRVDAGVFRGDGEVKMPGLGLGSGLGLGFRVYGLGLGG